MSNGQGTIVFPSGDTQPAPGTMSSSQASIVLEVSRTTVVTMCSNGELDAVLTPIGWIINPDSAFALKLRRDEGRGSRRITKNDLADAILRTEEWQTVGNTGTSLDLQCIWCGHPYHSGGHSENCIYYRLKKEHK